MNSPSTASPHHHHHHHHDDDVPKTAEASDMISFKLRPRNSRTALLLFETMDDGQWQQQQQENGDDAWWNSCNNHNNNRTCHIIPVCDDDDDLLMPLLVDDNIDASIYDGCCAVDVSTKAQQPLALRPRTTFCDHYDDDGVAADGELCCSLFHCYHPRTEPSFHLIRRSETSAFATPPVRQMNAALRQ